MYNYFIIQLSNNLFKCEIIWKLWSQIIDDAICGTTGTFVSGIMTKLVLK